jgi:hypothetical protein
VVPQSIYRITRTIVNSALSRYSRLHLGTALQKFESSTVLKLLGEITTVGDTKGNEDDSYGS